MPDAPPPAGLLLWDLVFSLGGSLGQGQGWQSEVGFTRLLGEAGSPSPSAAFQPRVRRSTADSPQRGREPGQHFFLGEEGADVLATAVLGEITRDQHKRSEPSQKEECDFDSHP